MHFGRILLGCCTWFFILSCGPGQEPPDCLSLREGRFRLHADKRIDSFLIIRKEGYQYEKNLRTRVVKTYKVNWIGDCEYLLDFQESRYEHPVTEAEKRSDSIARIVTRVTIKEHKNGYYIFEAQKEGISLKYGDTLWIDQP